MWGTVYVTIMCYHGDPVHAQALCTIPSPLVYGAWERGYFPKKFLHHVCVYVSSCSTNFCTVYVMYLYVHAYEFCSRWVECSVYYIDAFFMQIHTQTSGTPLFTGKELVWSL